MKRLLSLFSLLMTFVVGANAYAIEFNFKENGVTYRCAIETDWHGNIPDEPSVTISLAEDTDGDGSADYDDFNDIVVPGQVEYNGNYYAVTAIGAFGISDNTYGEEAQKRQFTGTLTLPAGIKDINAGAFSNCEIEKLVIKDTESVQSGAFSNCDITEIEVESETSQGAFFGYDAFKKCEIGSMEVTNNVRSIEISESSGTTIGTLTLGTGLFDDGYTKQTFSFGCDIDDLTLPSDIDSYAEGKQIIFQGKWGGSSKINNITIPDNLTSLSGVSFNNYTFVNDVEIKGASGFTIGDAEKEETIFNQCTFKGNLDLANVETVGKKAFYKCTFGTKGEDNKVTIKYEVGILESAFNECYFYSEIELDGAGDIEKEAFMGVTFEEKISLKGSVIKEKAFMDTYFKKGLALNVNSIETSAFENANINDSFSWNDDLHSIGSRAFAKANFPETSPTFPSELDNIGDQAFKGSNLSGISLNDGLTSIGAEAFDECTNLSNVWIPKTVTFIGIHAFCSAVDKAERSKTTYNSFTTIEVEAGNNYYVVEKNVLYDKAKTRLMRVPCGSTKLPVTVASTVKTVDPYACHWVTTFKAGTDIVLPEGLQTIGNNAFEHCLGLNDQFKIPSTVRTIQEEAFMDCQNLKYIKVPEGVTTIERSVFENCCSLIGTGSLGGNIIPSTVTTICNEAFQNCQSLPNIVFPDGLQSIGAMAFQWCYSMESPIIPDGVSSIGHEAFSHCKAFDKIELPDALTTIEYETFENCYNLTEIDLNNVTSIGNRAFQYCTSLPSVEIPSTVTTIGSEVFQHNYLLTSVNFAEPVQVTQIGSGAFKYSALPEIDFPGTVQIMGNDMFTHCKDLTGVTLNEGLLSIGDNAFSYCVKLPQEIVEKLPSTVNYIGANAFEYCDDFEVITIPETVKGIGPDAFSRCNSLHTVYFSTPEPPTKVATKYTYKIDEDAIGEDDQQNYTLWKYLEEHPEVKGNEWNYYSALTAMGWSFGWNWEPPYTDEINGVAETGEINYTNNYPQEGNVFEFCNPNLCVFVPLDYVDTYKENEYFSKGRLQQYDYYDYSAWGGGSGYNRGNSIYEINIIAPMLQHKKKWTSWSYEDALDFKSTTGVAGKSNPNNQIRAYRISSSDWEAGTTTAQRVGEVPDGDQYNGGYGDGGTGLIIGGTVNADEYYPVRLAPHYEGNLTDVEVSNYGIYDSDIVNIPTNREHTVGDVDKGYDELVYNSKNNEVPDAQNFREIDFKYQEYAITTGARTIPSVGENQLVGNPYMSVHYDNSSTWDNQTYFGLTNGVFKKLTNEGSVARRKAVLKIAGEYETTASAKTMMIVFDDNVTAIDGVIDRQQEVWYNLKGARLPKAPTEKGIYIRNGVKVIVK